MSNLNDETTNTFSSLAADATSSATDELNTSDNGESTTIFIDNGSGGAPADYTLAVERYSPLEDEWKRYSTVSQTGATDPESVTSEAIPPKMRATITNDSAGSATYRLNLVSY